MSTLSMVVLYDRLQRPARAKILDGAFLLDLDDYCGFTALPTNTFWILCETSEHTDIHGCDTPHYQLYQ